MLCYQLIDRNIHIREDLKQATSYLHKSRKIVLRVDDKFLYSNSGSIYFSFDDLKVLTKEIPTPIYLGLHEEDHYFCYQLSHRHPKFEGMELIGLRAANQYVEGFHLGLLFYVQGLLNWHLSHSFCPNCGSATKVISSGHSLECVNIDCRKKYFPKIDPAVIFSIINNDGDKSKILLGRQSQWADKRYSVIAGFVEHGEALEDAVRREAFEETGLTVNNVKYVYSQPWPFPNALMLGFSCTTSDTKINLLDQELETAGWFSAIEIKEKIISGDLIMPFSISISWYIIDEWYRSEMGHSLGDILLPD